ncbi:UTP--glucose-1-phosphate uridylyltransferase, partial [Clostridiales bacterium PH28_bin88]
PAHRRALRSLAKERPMYAYVFEGRRYDVGERLGFLRATVEFALKREDLQDSFREYLMGMLRNELKDSSGREVS